MDRGVQETAGFLGGEQVSSTVSRFIVALQRLISRTDYSNLFVRIQQKEKEARVSRWIKCHDFDSPYLSI
jgi:hypothetical protein